MIARWTRLISITFLILSSRNITNRVLTLVVVGVPPTDYSNSRSWQNRIAGLHDYLMDKIIIDHILNPVIS